MLSLLSFLSFLRASRLSARICDFDALEGGVGAGVNEVSPLGLGFALEVAEEDV